MSWRTLVAAAAIGTVITGCDRDRLPFFGQRGAQEPAPVEEAPAPVVEPEPAPVEVAPPPAPQPAPVRTPQPISRPVTGLQDEPWTPAHFGTVDPGMSRNQVLEQWGPPVAERQAGNWTYLFFRNGCEVTCGTFDVVMLEGGQVVDAIVRAQTHHYSGVSSSPRGSTPQPRLPDQGGVNGT